MPGVSGRFTTAMKEVLKRRVFKRTDGPRTDNRKRESGSGPGKPGHKLLD